MQKKKFIRGAGILLSVTSLPSEYGIGTLGTAAFEFIDMLVDIKQRYWQVLPLGPTSYGDSPYQAFSAFAGNPYVIDLELLVKDKLLTQQEILKMQWGDDEKDINYGKLFEFRFHILKIAFSNFRTDEKRFLEFCKAEQEWLEEYAVFMGLKTYFANKAWIEWDIGIRNREEATLNEYKEKLKEEIVFWKFCQYKFFEQWNAVKIYANQRGIQIIGDIPFYIAFDSADVWANKEAFCLNKEGKLDSVSGCPPDAFSNNGQVWGNPLYNWNYMEKTKFLWWRNRMHANAKMYDILRIDHFIGIVKYYVIPANRQDGKKGRYLKGPGKKLTEIIEKELGECRIIAEDLGVEIPGVKRLLEKMDWPGTKILQFAFSGNTAHEYLPHNYDRTKMAVYGGTHDNETLEGFFREKSTYELAFLYEYLNISKREQITDAIIRLAYSSIADIVIFQIQDILKLDNESRMNFPATIGRNWRFRIWQNCLDEKRRIEIRTMAMLYRR